MGQVMPLVLDRRRPRLVGLEEHLPDVFVDSAEELQQGLVLAGSYSHKWQVRR